MPPSSIFQLLAGLGAGVGGGLLSGLFGVGGGVILIPILRLVLDLNQHQAQGVTLAALLLPNSFPAMIHYRRQSVPIHWPLVWAMILSFLPGVWAGANLANRLPEGPLRLGFVVFLVILAVRTFLQKPTRRELETTNELGTSAWWPGLVIGLAGGLLSGLLVYAQHQTNFPWFVLAGLAVGFMSGTYLGARVATGPSGGRLRKAFAMLMLLTAGMMLWKQ